MRRASVLALLAPVLALTGCGREDRQVARVTTDERRALVEAGAMIGAPTAPASQAAKTSTR